MRRSIITAVCLTLLVASISSAAQTTITFMEVGDQSKLAAFGEYYQLWQTQHPDMKVEYNPLPYAESFVKMKAMMAAGDPFDVSPMYSAGYDPTFAQNGALLSLDDYMTKDGIKEAAFLPGAFNHWSQIYNGKRLALPYAMSGRVLWYNPDLFDTAGLSYPPTSWEDKGWTWDAFVNTAKKMTRDVNGDGVPDYWGLSNIANQMAGVMPFLWGKEIFNENFTEFIINSSGGAEAIQRYADLALIERVAPVPFSAAAKLSGFSGGRSGMTFEGAWAMGTARNWNIKWNWAVIPKGTQRATEIAIDNLYVARSADEETAWDWMKFLTTDTQAQTLYAGKGNGKIPTARQAAYQWVNGEMARLYPGLNIDVLLTAVPYDVTKRNGPAARNWSKVSPILNQAYNRIFSGQASALQACTEIKGAVDAALNAK